MHNPKSYLSEITTVNYFSWGEDGGEGGWYWGNMQVKEGVLTGSEFKVPITFLNSLQAVLELRDCAPASRNTQWRARAAVMCTGAVTCMGARTDTLAGTCTVTQVHSHTPSHVCGHVHTNPALKEGWRDCAVLLVTKKTLYNFILWVPKLETFCSPNQFYEMTVTSFGLFLN